MLALGSARSGASLGAWHAIIHCCKQKCTYTESIPRTAVPDGWQPGMLPGPNHLLQLGDRVSTVVKEGKQGLKPTASVLLFCCSIVVLAV